MGNGNSVSSKQTKDRRKSGDYESTDESKSRRPPNGNVPGAGGANGGGVSNDPKTGKKIPRATNPFIIFFLKLRSKKPREDVTVIARVAGKLWTKMSSDERKKYIDLANAEKKRREERKRKRKANFPRD
ncbi:uncharacterized protein [Venturia canescens]|uniref:uncharacterized protein n=1 Tax=Venturia canescens TaxID=32260 RepID=UPI001C9C8320|nr:uncharacterized protein LOC122413077 [Venturia canescens]